MKFKILAQAFEGIESTPKRLEMTDILAELFKKTGAENIKKIIYLIQNQVEPPFKGVVIGMGEKLVARSVAVVSGCSASEVNKKFQKTGDLGLVAQEVLETKKQLALTSKSLTVEKVYKNFYKIAKSSGSGSQEMKIKLLGELLSNANSLEAKFITRIPLNKLRLGIGDPTILDALSVKKAGDKSLREDLERAYNLCSDLGEVAEVFYKKGMKGIKKFRITPGNPIRPMAGERLKTAEDIIEKIGKCAVEGKYDGLRLQVHKKANQIWIFSRNLENMTHMFPDVVSEIKKLKKDLILEGEALLYNEKKDRYLPFQETIQRKRKHDVSKFAREYPLTVFMFDMLYFDGKDLTQRPYSERRKYIEKIKETNTLKRAQRIVTDDPKEFDNYFKECVKDGLEGVMAKDLNAIYIAGARKFGWIKLKKSYQGKLADTIDAVILGYFRGKGHRAKFGFGGFLAGVYDEEKDEFKTICKVGTGFSEDQMKELKIELDKIKLKEKDKRVVSNIKADFWVEPKLVVQLTADEISKSPIHTADSLALRFPRLISKTFVDKTAEQATTVYEINELYGMQG